MSRPLELLRDLRRDPLRDPLRALVGTFTIGVAMLLLGALEVAEEQMTSGSLFGIGAGLCLTVPTALAAAFDYWDLPKGTPGRTAATLHLVVMVLATALFALTFALQLDGYGSHEVTTGAWVAGLGALALLIAGGYVGRALVFPLRRARGWGHPPVPGALTARLAPQDAAEPAAQGGEIARCRRWPRRRRRAAAPARTGEGLRRSRTVGRLGRRR